MLFGQTAIESSHENFSDYFENQRSPAKASPPFTVREDEADESSHLNDFGSPIDAVQKSLVTREVPDKVTQIFNKHFGHTFRGHREHLSRRLVFTQDTADILTSLHSQRQAILKQIREGYDFVANCDDYLIEELSPPKVVQPDLNKSRSMCQLPPQPPLSIKRLKQLSSDNKSRLKRFEEKDAEVRKLEVEEIQQKRI